MIGLLGAKIWVENRVELRQTRSTWSAVAAGLIIGIGTSELCEITDDFSLGGIALGTIVVIVGYHLASSRREPAVSTRRRGWQSR